MAAAISRLLLPSATGHGDLQLLRRQRVRRSRVATAQPRPACPQLGGRARPMAPRGAARSRPARPLGAGARRRGRARRSRSPYTRCVRARSDARAVRDREAVREDAVRSAWSASSSRQRRIAASTLRERTRSLLCSSEPACAGPRPAGRRAAALRSDRRSSGGTRGTHSPGRAGSRARTRPRHCRGRHGRGRARRARGDLRLRPAVVEPARSTAQLPRGGRSRRRAPGRPRRAPAPGRGPHDVPAGEDLARPTASSAAAYAPASRPSRRSSSDRVSSPRWTRAGRRCPERARATMLSSNVPVAGWRSA